MLLRIETLKIGKDVFVKVLDELFLARRSSSWPRSSSLAHQFRIWVHPSCIMTLCVAEELFV